MSETETEGVIRFAYDLAPPRAPIADALLRPLNAWRHILRRLGIVGQDPARYGGLGFGNLSARDPDGETFVITATQTGHLDVLEPDHYARITGYNLDRFWVDAEGVSPPSSEALTHASIFRCEARIKCIFHGHSPDIFRAARALKLPTIAPHVQYGTASMAEAVRQLLDENMSRPMLFVSLGHTDGVFACGANARDTGSLLVNTLARALQAESIGE